MAIKPKGKKVTGTKKKDKITWTSNKLWKKALTVKAGAGNDVINFKKSNYKNTLYGEAGNDKIYGGKKTDKIYGGKGNDKLYGYNGNDMIKGGAGNDYIDGGAGNDKIYGESGKNTIHGGAGNDVIYAGTGNDYIDGGAGNDKIYGGKGASTLTGGAGDDTIYADGGSTVRSSAGRDEVNFEKTGHNLFTDNSSANTIFYTTLKGLSGNDTISVNNIEDIFMFDELELELDNYGNKYICIPDYMDKAGVLDVNIRLTSTNYTASLRTFISNMGYEVVSGNATIDYWVQKVVAEGGAATITGADHGAGATIRTGNKNDIVNISTGRNNIYTNGGDDIINVTGGVNNGIAAGQGHNTINVSGGKNKISLAGEDEVNITGGYNTVYCEDIDETINAIGGMNEIYGAGGDDYIIGNPNGGTTFYIYENDGNDTISTGHGAGIKADVIKFCDNSLDQLFFSFDGVDGMLQYDNYVIRIKDFLASEDVTDINDVNIWVEDTNGKRCRLTDLYTNELESGNTYGSDYSDLIRGTDMYADTMFGGLGNDTICYDTRYNDTMYGGEGENLYSFTYASGSADSPNQVSVYSTSGKDTIYVYHPNKEVFVRNGSDLVIQTSVEYYTDDHAFVDINIKDWFNNPVDISYDNSYTTVSILDKVNQMGLYGVTCGTTSGDTVSGVSGLYIAGDGNDSITAANTSSKIFGGSGKDDLNGGSGDDTIYAGYASKIEGEKFGSFNDNHLYGKDGNDWLYSYGENAHMDGGDGNDHYSVLLSSTTYIHDYRGTNVLHIEKPDTLAFEEERAYIVFNVDTDGKLVSSAEGFQILNKSSYDYWLTCGDFSNANGKFGGISVCNGYSLLDPSSTAPQALDQIIDSRGRYTDKDHIYALAQDVASWLSGTDYESVSEVIKTGTAQQKSELIAIFDNFNNTQWLQANG